MNAGGQVINDREVVVRKTKKYNWNNSCCRTPATIRFSFQKLKKFRDIFFPTKNKRKFRGNYLKNRRFRTTLLTLNSSFYGQFKTEKQVGNQSGTVKLCKLSDNFVMKLAWSLLYKKCYPSTSSSDWSIKIRIGYYDRERTSHLSSFTTRSSKLRFLWNLAFMLFSYIFSSIPLTKSVFIIRIN